MLDLSTKIKSLPLKAVLFDLDDTLYESAPIYALGLRNAWECFCSQTARKWDLNQFQDAYNTARSSAKNLAPNSPTRHNRLIYFSFLVHNIIGKPSAELALKLNAAYTAAYSSIDFAPARELLQKLRHHLKIAIITNQTMDAQLHKLLALDPKSELIDCLVTSEEVGVEKPHARVFEECLKRLQVAPDEALMIGDDWENDIVGASSQGIASVYLNRNGSHQVVQPSPLIISTNSISHIIQLLQDHISIS